MRWLLLNITFFFLLSCTQIKEEQQQSDAYQAGFKTIHIVDTSRIYKPKTDTSNYLHYRPIDIDLWYPATVTKTDSTIMFRDILGLLEARANYYTASNSANGFTQQIAQYLCEGFKCSDTTKLLNYRTGTYKNATPAASKFPLVIYLCAFNGMSYENYSLFETLAAKGFAVASISSIGRYPGDMTMKFDDIMEQVNDAVISLKQLQQKSNIDFSKIAVVGYSWGGLAAALLVNKISNVTCLVSLDGSEFHHYGEAKDENDYFNNIVNSTDFKAINITVPYLRLESSPAQTDKEDSVYNFLQKVAGEKTIFEIDSAQHEDFGCLSEVIKRSGNCPSNGHYNTALKLTVSFIEDHLKNTNTFAHVIEEEKNKIIKKEIKK